MANREETLRQFCDVTGADDNRSKFFLESSNWQLEVALSSFYEHGGNIEESSNPPPVVASPQPMSESDMDSPPGSPQKQKKDKKKKSSTTFATLDSLKPDSSSDEEEEEILKLVMHNSWFPKIEAIVHNLFCYNVSCPKKEKLPNIENELKQEIVKLTEEIEKLKRENSDLRNEISRLTPDEGQAFYAGGSERSGQQILGPGKGRKDIVSEMFKSVRERGAVVFEDEPSSTSGGRGGIFSGVGYRLGQTADDHESVTPANAAQADQARSVRLRLYREGFTVDDGPLRQFSDPANADFLSCIRRGEIPPELSGGGKVRVSLEDRRLEECPRVVSKTQAFTGKGQMLGSPTPATVGATVPVASQAGDREANHRAAQQDVGLNETNPITTVQFRLADGSRLTGRFNHSHTVEDLYQYVSRAEPIYQLQPFILLTTFPSSELNDRAATLAAANLLNTTVLQRLK